MYEGFYGWSLESVGKGTVRTEYVVEYITDPKIADELERTGDPELFARREFDNVSKALAFYLRWFVDEKCIIVRLWENVFVNDEQVLEQMIEPAGYTQYFMRKVVNREMTTRMNMAEHECRQLRRSTELYEKFVESLGEKYEDMFKEFCKQEAMRKKN